MLQEQTKIFKALADPNRIRIIKLLQQKSLCVCEITELLKLAGSTVSQHLNVLKSVDIILESKDGRWVNYSINPKPAEPITASILSMMHLWFNDDTVIKSDLKKSEKVNRADLCQIKI